MTVQGQRFAGQPDAPLSVLHVSHGYGGKRALKDVTFAIRPSSFMVLLGLNGAGKTTLFSLVSRLYDLRQGNIEIFGQDVRRSSTAALRKLGIVFQARTLDFDLTVQQNLSYHAALHGIGAAEARARIGELMALMDMKDRVHDKARALSGGQMRRVEIARALLHRPALLMLDEATVGLDIQSRAAILSLIRSLVASQGIGVLWATHLIDEVGESDDVAVLHRGKLLAAGGARDLLRATAAPSIRDAFMLLTGLEAAKDEAP